MAEKKFTTALLITGDGTGAQKAIKLTQDQLDGLNKKVEASNDTWKKWASEAAGAGASAAKWAAARKRAALLSLYVADRLVR